MTTYYAVNTETKQHVKIPDMRYKPQGVEWKVVEGDDEGWIAATYERLETISDDTLCDMLTISGALLKERLISKTNWNYVAFYKPLHIGDYEVEQQEWNGKGLPPVGTVCEVIEPDDGEACWTETTVIARSEGIVWLSGNGLQQENRLRFRPIRSAEQRAEEEAIEEMLDITTAMHISDMKEAMKSLYEAGYRKTVEN